MQLFADIPNLFFWFEPFGWPWLIMTGIAIMFAAGAVEGEAPFAFANISAGIVTVVSALGDNLDWVTWLRDNPTWLAVGLATYVPLGAIWIIYHWYFVFLPGKRHEYEGHKRKWLLEHEQPAINVNGNGYVIRESERADFLKTLGYSNYYRIYKDCYSDYDKQAKITPAAHEYRVELMYRAAYWPLSVGYYLLHDLVYNIFSNVVSMVSVTLDRLTKRKFGDVQEDS